MKTLELLNIDELNKLIGGEITESLTDSLEITDSLTDSLEVKKFETKALNYDFSKLTALTK